MAQKRNEFIMDAEFRCQKCASIIGVRVPLASVKATGHEVECRHCEARYLVTEEGATPVDKAHLSGTVHHGHLAWDPSHTHDEMSTEG